MQIPPGGQEEALAFEISRTSISIKFPKMLYHSLQHTFPSSLWGIYLSGIELDPEERSKSIPVFSTLKEGRILVRVGSRVVEILALDLMRIRRGRERLESQETKE